MGYLTSLVIMMPVNLIEDDEIDELIERMDHFIEWARQRGDAAEDVLCESLIDTADAMVRVKRPGKARDYYAMAERWASTHLGHSSEQMARIIKGRLGCENRGARD